jgi:hypothetical protein
MASATIDGITMINFGMGSPNAAIHHGPAVGGDAQGGAVPGQVRWPKRKPAG